MAMDRLFAESEDELAAMLGAESANQCGDDDRALQDEAITLAEAWVGESISNGSLNDRIAGFIWVHGPRAADILHEKLNSRGAT